MTTTEILAAIDGEISRLTQARSLLVELESSPPVADLAAASLPRRRGRPKRSTNQQTSSPTPKRRTLSPEGRARIAAAQHARWARQHKAAASTSTKNASTDSTSPTPRTRSAKGAATKPAAPKNQSAIKTSPRKAAPKRTPSTKPEKKISSTPKATEPETIKALPELSAPAA